VRVAANPRRVSEIATNKMNASIPVFRFRYRQSLSAAARSGYPDSASYSPSYVTVSITLPWSTDGYRALLTPYDVSISDVLIVRALKISQLTDGGMPPTYDSMH
jgi:hypothetical protein